MHSFRMENHRSQFSKKKKKEMTKVSNICSTLRTSSGMCAKERGGNQCKMKGRQREEGVALWFFGHVTSLTRQSTDCGSTRSRRATRSKSQWSTLVFCLDNFHGKSFGRHLPPKRGEQRQLENTRISDCCPSESLLVVRKKKKHV